MPALTDVAQRSPLLWVVVMVTGLVAPDSPSLRQRGSNSLLTGAEEPVANGVHVVTLRLHSHRLPKVLESRKPHPLSATCVNNLDFLSLPFS